MNCIGAKVNGKIVPLRSTLKSGDQVEIITSANQEPHQDWLSFVKTAKARQRIKKYLREAQQAQTLKFGDELLLRYFKKYNINKDNADFKNVIQKLGFHSLDSLLLALGSGEFSVDQITKKLFPGEAPPEKKETFFRKYTKRARSDSSIKVQGMNDVLINFGKCCQPVPGDKIIGFLTKGRGITVHRIDCKNMLNLKEDHEKKLKVSWDIGNEQSFHIHLSVLGEDRRELLSDVSQTISRCDSNILVVNFKVEDSLAKGNLVVQVRDLHHLTKIIHSIRKVAGIITVERVEGSAVHDQNI